MKRKFKPYLDIKDKKQLQFLLNRQNSIDENYFDLSQIEDISEKAFKDAVVKVKNFYGYTPKGEDVEFIDDIIYHMLIVQALSIYVFQLQMDMIISMKEDDFESVGDLITNPLNKTDIKNLEFLSKEIISINSFIKKYYGDDFYELKYISPDKFMKYSFDDFIKFLNKIKAVIIIIANFAKNFRLKMLIFNIVNFTYDGNYQTDRNKSDK